MTVTPPSDTLLDPNDGSVTWIGSPTPIPGVTASFGTTMLLDGVVHHGTSSLDMMSGASNDNKDAFSAMVNVDAMTANASFIFGQAGATFIFDVFSFEFFTDFGGNPLILFARRDDSLVKQARGIVDLRGLGTAHILGRTSDNGSGPMTVWVNGVEVSSYDLQETFSGGVHSPRNSLVIGGTSGGAQLLTGFVDRIKIWESYTPTSGEISEEAGNELALIKKPSGLVQHLVTPAYDRLIPKMF